MGCFNMKCALTDLPVRHGDAVVVLFGIRPSNNEKSGDYAGGFEYQPHFFKLVAPPLYGEYNDYGWIEDVDKTSIDNFVIFNRLAGDACIETGTLRNVDHNDMFKLLREGMRKKGCTDADEVDFDYTFVHRAAWDKLLEAGRECIHHEHVMLRLTGNEDKELKEQLEKFHMGDSSVSVHGEISWLTADVTRPQIFKMAVHRLPEILIDYNNDIDLPDNIETLPPAEQAIIMRDHMIAFRASMNYDNSVARWLMTTLSWFRPLFKRDESLGRAKPHSKEVCAIIREAQTNQAFYKMLEDVDVMFNSLMENMLVIRASSDLPSQSQDSTYWGHIAITRAMGEIIHERAVSLMEDMQEDEDSAASIVSQDVIENMMQTELKSTY